MVWLITGFTGQAMFSARFMVQWLASERMKRSIIPEAFWYLSLAGGLVLLAYAIHRQDPIFILGQSVGCFIYLRNIYFVRREKLKRSAGEA